MASVNVVSSIRVIDMYPGRNKRSDRIDSGESYDSLHRSDSSGDGWMRRVDTTSADGTDAIEIVQFSCGHSESVFFDLLGLRLSGSRSSGVFVHSLQCGSAADKTGQIQPNDQLLQVENISLIGLTPDQVVRVLRTAFSMSSNGLVRLKIAHSWASQYERQFRPMTPISPGHVTFSRSDMGLASRISSISLDMENTGTQSNLGMPNGIKEEGESCSKTTNGFVMVPKANTFGSHPLGAVKLRRSTTTDHTAFIPSNNGQSKHTITVTAEIVQTPPCFVPSQDVNKNQKQKQVPVMKEKKERNGKRVSIVSEHDHEMEDDHGECKLPGIVESKNSNLRHRRKTAVVSPTGDNNNENGSVENANHKYQSSMKHSKTWDYGGGGGGRKGTMVTEDEIRGTFYPKSKTSDRNDFAIKKVPSVRGQNSFDDGTEAELSDSLPLVSFDQLTRTSPSPTYSRESSEHQSSSGQSKCSKGSFGSSGRSSQGSQQLSWQCPVCLDGASRIRRTKRRMMSTPCGHVFCNMCVEDVVHKYHICPTCRAWIGSMEDVHPIFM